MSSERPLSILHIILILRPTNGQYNEHCLPLMHERDIGICTYFKAQLKPPEAITLFEGDDTLIGFWRTLRTALKTKEYDIIHVHTPHAGILLLATLFLSGLYGKLKSSIVHTVQNSYPVFKLRHKLMFIPSFPFFQQLVFCSHASYESFPSFMKWLGGDRMDVVQNAVDLKRIDRMLESADVEHHDRFKIVTVGLIEMKNPFTVLDAFHQVEDGASDLTYLGEGNLRPALTQKIEDWGLHQVVKLTGMIDRDSVFEHFAAADVFVSASIGEGLPVAVLEAMACGCPVVLSDIPPHREIAVGTDIIPLIAPGDVAGFVREIKKLKEMPQAERRAIGQKCRKLIEGRFSLPIMHTRYKEIYSRMTDKPISFPLVLSQ